MTKRKHSREFKIEDEGLVTDRSMAVAQCASNIEAIAAPCIRARWLRE